MTTTTASIPTQAEPVKAAGLAHGSRIITALESAWTAIRAQHPDVPPVLMITGTGRNRHSVKWGHFGERRWTVEGADAKKARTHELFAGGELLSLGGRATMKTLLHEAAHALAHVRDIKDTSSDYRYHNRRFVELAEELGLIGPAKMAPVIGWSDCAITDDTAQRYADVIATLDAARLPYVHDPFVASLFGGAQPTGSGEDDDEGDDETGEGARPEARTTTRSRPSRRSGRPAS